MNKRVSGRVGLVFAARGSDLQAGWYSVGLFVAVAWAYEVSGLGGAVEIGVDSVLLDRDIRG
jgi:hypothetical protein